MTKNEAKQTALRWLDEATAGGRSLPAQSTTDWLDRMDYLLDAAVAVVCGLFPHRAVYSAACLPVRNLVSAKRQSAQIFPPETYTVTTPPFQSYSLEIQGTGTLTLLRAGRVEKTQMVDSGAGFTRVYGVCTADTLQVKSNYPFCVRGVGLYPDSYPEQAVPLWQARVPVQLPQDFSVLEKVLYSGDGVRFERFSDYRRAGDRVYTVPRQLSGQLDFYYIRTPKVLGAQAQSETELDVEEAAACLVPLRLATDVLAGVDETAVLATYLSSRYNEMASAISRRRDPEHDRVETVYAL